MVFYRKWRPQTLAEVVGQEHVTKTLRNALLTNQVAHAYLFCGPRGTGKTSTGRILAKALNCLAPDNGEPCNACSMCQAITEGRALDLIEIDAASNRGIDDIRELRERVNFAPNTAKYKVYIIDEVHQLTQPAFDALLKTLEEPPPHARFVLATTEVHKVPPTILSRCQRFDFRRLSQSAVVGRLKYICDKEGISIEPEAIGLIARSATGSLRDAENLLEQLATYYGTDIQFRQVQSLLGATGDWRTKELAKCLFQKDIAAGLTTINKVSSDGLDLRQFNRELVEYLRGLLLLKAGTEASVNLTSEEIAEAKALITTVAIDEILKAIRLFGQVDLRLDAQSSLPLELAFVECALPNAENKKAPLKEETKAETPRPASALTAAPVEKSLGESVSPHMPTAPPSLNSVAPVEKPLIDSAAPPLDPGKLVEQLAANWKRVVEASRQASKQASKKVAIDALLRNACEPVAIENSTVVLGFYHPFHMEKIDNPENRRIVEEVLSKVLGAPHRVRCILTPRDKKAMPKPVDSHLVRAAIEMGAKIIDTQ